MSLFTQLPEDFLHHIWRTCNFDLRELKTLGGAPVYIRNPGVWNHNQGPDFLDARLSIDGMEWYGQIELHVHSQDWYKHGHHLDKAYNNTILHVVLHSKGKPIFRQDGTAIPELILQERIRPILLNRYKQLQLEEASIPCQDQVQKVSPSTIQQTLSSAALERIQQKVYTMQENLSKKVQDWEQVLWEESLRIMGGPVNGEVFRELAQRLPIRTFRKQQDKLVDLEALMFGASGMLSGQSGKDEYVLDLLQRWDFLKKKLSIQVPFPLDIRFMRMRPASFPTIRMAQVAHLIYQFPLLTDLLSLEGFQKFQAASIQASSYWENHYRFHEVCKPSPKKLGSQQKSLLLINTFLPMTIIYHQAHGRRYSSESVKEILAQLPKEKNKITRSYESLSWQNNHGLSSQGMIQLSKYYCRERRCLHCEIGKEILA